MALENFLIVAGLLLLFAKILGSLSSRLGVSSIVGEIIAGIILGPIIGLVVLGEFMNSFIILGIIVLLFLAGLEVKFDKIKKNMYMAIVIALGGGLASFFLGVLVGLMFFQDMIVGIAIGTIIATTSNDAMFRLLIDRGYFNTPLGNTVIAATIADDVLGLMMLSIFTVIVTESSLTITDIDKLFFIAVGVYLVILTAGTRIIHGIISFFRRFRDSEILLTIPLVIALLLAYFTQNIGLSLAAGAFLAGITMSNIEISPAIEPKIKTIGNGFLIPLFYAAVGTMLVITELNPYLIAAIFFVAVIGKLAGSGLLSKLLGFRRSEAQFIGISLMPRGNENIAIAQLVFLLGIISIEVYASVIYAILVTIVLTPVLLKLFYK